MTDGNGAAAPSQGLVARIWATWAAPRDAMAAELAAAPREAALLVWVYLAAAFGFLAGLPDALAQAGRMAEDDALAAVMAGRLFGAVFITPLALYGLAFAARGIAGLMGGGGTRYRGRVVLFWAVLAAAPLVLLSGLVAAVLPAVSPPVNLVTALGFLWLWAQGLAEAEGFGRPGHVFAVILAILTVLAAIVFLTAR